MEFEEYVVNWFHDFVKDHESDNEWCRDLFCQMGFTEDLLDEDEGFSDYLMGLDGGNEIYEALFGYSAKVGFVDDLPDTDGFLLDMFQSAVSNLIKEYDFAQEFVENMVSGACNYTNPIGYFEDLQRGGVASGMVGMFIYHSDCKDFYIEHIDSMEDFIEDLEEEIGCPIKNQQRLPHYTFICWVCYEELGYKLARTLWENEF